MSDTAQRIGERLADAIVEQCADMGGSPADFREAMNEASGIIFARVTAECQASRKAADA